MRSTKIISMSFEPNILELMKQQRGRLSRSKYVKNLVLEKLDIMKRNEC